MTKHSFTSVKELATSLGISRTTLYKRAKYASIELIGTYTDEQIDILKGVQNSEHPSEHNEHESEQNWTVLSEQLTVKDQQIKELHEQLKQAQKLVDQAQQLQLKTQLQLEEKQEKILLLESANKEEEVPEKKGFWRSLFGK